MKNRNNYIGVNIKTILLKKKDGLILKILYIIIHWVEQNLNLKINIKEIILMKKNMIDY